MAPRATAREVDWGDVYTTLISHTSMRYGEIGECTIPQLEAIMRMLGKHISLKLGVPWSGEPVAVKESGKAPKLSEIMAFCQQFKGTGGR